MKIRHLIFLMILIQLLIPGLKTGARAQNSTQTIIEDMTLAPDAPLHGTEGLSWGSGHASPQPMNCPATNWKGEWFRAMTCWGQVYIPRAGSTATNTRCQIRNLVTKFLLTDGTWVVKQSGNPSGAAFLENYANNTSMNADIRNESANGGGISVKVGIGPYEGYNFHYWASSGRAGVDINNIRAVFTTCEARLIQDDPNLPDDRADQILLNSPLQVTGISEFPGVKEEPVSISPNPVRNLDSFVINTGKAGLDAVMTIYSAAGKMVHRENLVLSKSGNRIKAGLQSGFYSVTIQAEDFYASGRLLIE